MISRMISALVHDILSVMTQPAIQCVILVLIKVVVGQEWRVSYPQHGACALEGSSVNTSCSYSFPSHVTDQEVSVQWMTIHRYQDHIHVTCRDQTRVCSLHIYPVKSSDARDYYCKVTVNGAVKWIGQPGFKLLATDLNVLAPKSLKEGDNMTLICNTKCKLSGSPSFIWSKDGRPVEKKQIIYNQLQLHPVSYEDEGSYTCAVRGHEDLPSPPMRIKVMYSPKSTQIAFDPSGELTEGSTVTLTCMSEADPPVHTYTWIKKSGTVELKSGEGKTLIFSKIHSEDSGEYLCRAANEIGKQDSPVVSVRVLYPPKNTIIVSDPSGDHITEGNRVTLTCMSEADPPVHTYTWIKKSGDVELKSGEEKTLTFSNIRSEDSGEYLCRAANRIGQQESPAVSILVFYPPKNTIIVSDPSGDHITEGNRVTLTCMSEAHPPVHTYTWIKKSGAVELKSGEGKTLTFSNIRSEDSGEYLCRADNEIGKQDSPPVIVQVVYPPKNTTVFTSPSGVITKDTSVTLTCSSAANPPVENYTWFKVNDSTPVGSGQQYNVTNISSEDGEEYYCEASNKYGAEKSPAVSLTIEGEQRPLVTAVNKYESQTSTAVSITTEVTGAQSPLRTAAAAAVVAGVSVAIAVALLLGLISVGVWMRCHTRGKQKKTFDVQYTCNDSQGTGLSNATDPLGVEALGGADDDVHYDTVIFTGVHFRTDADTNNFNHLPEEEPLATHASAQHTA